MFGHVCHGWLVKLQRRMKPAAEVRFTPIEGRSTVDGPFCQAEGSLILLFILLSILLQVGESLTQLQSLVPEGRWKVGK